MVPKCIEAVHEGLVSMRQVGRKFKEWHRLSQAFIAMQHVTLQRSPVDRALQLRSEEEDCVCKRVKTRKLMMGV
jgi:hypothetical protein